MHDRLCMRDKLFVEMRKCIAKRGGHHNRTKTRTVQRCAISCQSKPQSDSHVLFVDHRFSCFTPGWKKMVEMFAVYCGAPGWHCWLTCRKLEGRIRLSVWLGVRISQDYFWYAKKNAKKTPNKAKRASNKRQKDAKWRQITPNKRQIYFSVGCPHLNITQIIYVKYIFS